MIKVSTTGMAVSLKTDLRFPKSGQQGHGTRIIQERLAILNALLSINCFPAGMEYFPAASEEQFEFIKRVIDRSDYYILIIGGRYGSVDGSGVSYTEKEYDYAVAKGIPILVFVRDDVDNLPVKFVECDKKNKVKLEQFKKKAMKERLCNYWSQEYELSAKVMQSLNNAFKTFPRPGLIRYDDVGEIVRLKKLGEKKSRKESDYIALGNKLRDEDDSYPSAVQQYLYAIFLNEDYETAYIRIIETAVMNGEYSDAWKVYEEAAKRFPESHRVYGSRGYIECGEGKNAKEKNAPKEYIAAKYEDAVRDCTKAISLQEDRWYYNTRGRALWGLKKRYEALADFYTSHRLSPKYPHAITNIKNMCELLGADNVIDHALQEDDRELRRMYLECVLIADEKNERAQKELVRLQTC